jgi:MFS family permease
VSDGVAEPAEVRRSRRRPLVITVLGVGQILAWGASYYLPAVLAAPIAADTGWPATTVMAALSAGLLVSGLVSPRIGQLIERHGGRPVLALSAVLLGLGLLIQGLATSEAMLIGAWLVIGVGMGAGLYDPAFSTLTRLYGAQARSAITSLTLWGGFASTVCWPLSALLVEQVGWRGASLAYAAVMAGLILPLYWLGLPAEDAHAAPAASPAPVAVSARTRRENRVFLLMLAVSFTVASVVMTVIAVHLITMLRQLGFDLATAVALGMLIGPSQVGARVLEAAFGRKVHPIWSLLVCTLAVAVGLVTLLGSVELAALGLILYGGGNGLRSIARGTVPLAMFGREGYAVLLGWLALPVLVAQAVSPTLGDLMLRGLGTEGTIAALAVASALNVLATLVLVPIARRRGVVGT